MRVSKAQVEFMQGQGFLTVAEVARRVGVTDKAIHYFLKSRADPTVKVQRAGKMTYVHARSFARAYTTSPDLAAKLIRDMPEDQEDAPDEGRTV